MKISSSWAAWAAVGRQAAGGRGQGARRASREPPPHRPRARHQGRWPVHVTLRAREALPSLRSARVFLPILQRARSRRPTRRRSASSTSRCRATTSTSSSKGTIPCGCLRPRAAGAGGVPIREGDQPRGPATRKRLEQPVPRARAPHPHRDAARSRVRPSQLQEAPARGARHRSAKLGSLVRRAARLRHPRRANASLRSRCPGPGSPSSAGGARADPSPSPSTPERRGTWRPSAGRRAGGSSSGVGRPKPGPAPPGRSMSGNAGAFSAAANPKPGSRAPRRAPANETLLVRAVRKPGSVPALPPVMIIPLGRPLLDGSCDLLGIESTRATPARLPSRSQTGLAPGGVCLCPLLAEGAVRSYRTVSPLPAPMQNISAGGLFSVALSFESPRLAVSQHPALRSPDFPRRDVLRRPAAITCPTRTRSGRTISPASPARHPRGGGARLSRSSSDWRISGTKVQPELDERRMAARPTGDCRAKPSSGAREPHPSPRRRRKE